jgi:hypothetical protein
MTTDSYATRTLQRVNGYLSHCYQSTTDEDHRAQLDNLGCLYHWLVEAVAAQSREFRHYIEVATTAEQQRDDAFSIVEELRDEIADLQGQLDALAVRS